MSAWRWQLGRWRRRLGWPGQAGAALCLVALLFLAAGVPVRSRIAALDALIAAEQARAAQPAGAAPASPDARLAAFFDAFPPRASVGNWLEQIYSAGSAAALELDKADYKLAVDPASQLLRYEIDLPVQGNYVQIRRFAGDALTRVPTLALRDIQFRRDLIDSNEVEARIHFVLYLREGA